MIDSHPKNGIEVKAEKLGPDSAVVRMSGYIDTYNSTGCQQKVNKILQKGMKNLVFDLSEVNYISSTGIGLFINTLKQVREKDGDIILTGMASCVAEVFQLLGFATFFTTAETVDEAKGYVPSVGVTEIPFEKMHSITRDFEGIEGFIRPENEPDFYESFLRVLRKIEELKR